MHHVNAIVLFVMVTDQLEHPWLANYPKGVPATVDYPNDSISTLLSDAAATFQERPATLFFGSKMSYNELDAAASRFAAALTSLGINHGDRIALCLPNCPQYLIAYFGVLRAGGTVVQINPVLSERELAFELADAAAETIVALDLLVERVATVWEETPLKRLIRTSLGSYVPFTIRLALKVKSRGKVKPPPASAEVLEMETLLIQDVEATEISINPANDVAVLQYTGGTTGNPKAAMLTHSNLMANSHQVRAWLNGITVGEEVMLAALPLFHVYGMTICMNLALLIGATIVLLPRMDLPEIVKAIDRHKVSVFPGVPSLYTAVSHQAKRRKIDLSSIKICISGSAPLPIEVTQKFEEQTGGRLVEGYGLSESSPVTHVNPIWGGEARVGSIGLPLPSTECRVIDVETGGNDMPAGEPGELIIRGPQVMKGYWNRPDETEETLRGGWLHTGDIVVMDNDGYFSIVDRKKDLIISGGFNVYPREVEEVLCQHPKITECAVVGEPDSLKGETVKAFLVLKEKEDTTRTEIQDWCEERLAPYKIPRRIEVLKELPRSAIGKVLRRELRDRCVLHNPKTTQ